MKFQKALAAYEYVDVSCTYKVDFFTRYFASNGQQCISVIYSTVHASSLSAHLRISNEALLFIKVGFQWECGKMLIPL